MEDNFYLAFIQCDTTQYPVEPMPFTDMRNRKEVQFRIVIGSGAPYRNGINLKTIADCYVGLSWIAASFEFVVGNLFRHPNNCVSFFSGDASKEKIH